MHLVIKSKKIAKMWSAILFLVTVSVGSQVLTEYVLENRHLGLFQGDIKLRNRTGYSERNVITNREGRWPGGVVVYSLDETYSDSDRELIRSALEEFKQNTCIRWIERTDEEVYVSIENDMGCWSHLGREGGIQSLSLESPMCMDKGVIMHEMMHTLGFLHEHVRHDRDNYVRVNWDNIIRNMEPNFEKLSPLASDNLGLDYDYRSIMHYTAYKFARDRSRPTLIPTNSDVPLSDLGYGQANAVFSELDIKKINTFYECPSK